MADTRKTRVPMAEQIRLAANAFVQCLQRRIGFITRSFRFLPLFPIVYAVLG